MNSFRQNATMRIYALLTPGPVPPAQSATPPHQAEAEAMCVRLKTVLRSLKPVTEKGKANLEQALAEVSRFHGSLRQARLGRQSLSELEATLEANPDDALALAVYRDMALRAIGGGPPRRPG